ncbi:MAG: chemotaxis response regulator protein-glutamate methylesterase [Fusobacteriia bacterium 4572_132]|nr:MAG: chemotaxis response regulator protein-glutamate methylesterase [Fusobacteriia bacterium 4572_132]
MTIKVLIVDDSILIRKILTDILNSDDEIKVIGVAPDPYIARTIIAKEKPDVITLDIEMPKMDGLTFLKNLMKSYPIPTVIISSLSLKGSEIALEALENGAIDIIEKPRGKVFENLQEIGYLIIEKIKAASKVKKISTFNLLEGNYKKGKSLMETTNKILTIGASTGGPEAIYKVISKLPYDYHGIAIVIHMPAGFTSRYAKSLDKSCNMTVKEAKDGDKLYKGIVLIAPGGKQMYIRRSGSYYYVEIKADKIYNYHRPSIDLLFLSAAEYAGRNAIGVILTGMGDDGAEGITRMKEEGAITIAQNEESSVVFGMPKKAIALGGIDKVENLENISKELLKI